MKIKPHELALVIDHMANDIVEHYKTQGAVDKQHIIEKIKEFIATYEDMRKKMSLIDVADTLHIFADERVEFCKKMYNGWDQVKCKQGCSHCCKMAVAITQEEALLLKAVMGGKIPFKTLKIQARYNPHNWHQLNDKYRSCIFLKEGKCIVYEYRPHACRVHFEIGDPQFCDIKKYKGYQTQMWRPIEIQVISAAITIIGDADYMPVKLLDVFDIKL
jgi:Fe-S-cluster containining protein